MNLAAFIVDISRDADPAAPGFQAQTVYVLLNLFVPLVVGFTVAIVLQSVEKLFGAHDDGEAQVP